MSPLYHTATYWNTVAERLASREQHLVLAGDDEPFYRYKRGKLLTLLNEVNFTGKKVLELGPGPGGNLLEILKWQPTEIHGADVSEKMIALAEQTLKGKNAVLKKIDEQSIPYPDNYFDISFTVTVLQHNTNEAKLMETIGELCRVSCNDIYIFERIEPKLKGNQLCLGRPVNYYAALFAKHGFVLAKTTYLNINASYLACGAIRKLFNSRNKKEGEPASTLSKALQTVALLFTTKLDSIFKAKRDLARLHFVKA